MPEAIEQTPQEKAITKTVFYQTPSFKKNVIATVGLIVLALVSILVIAPFMSSPETFADAIETLNEKRNNVMGLLATTSGASIAISLLPSDAGGPIASQLADLSSYIVVILAIIYLEKFLLTILGFVGFGVFVPIACALSIVCLWIKSDTSSAKGYFFQLASKFFALGLVLAFVVPISVALTDWVDNSFDESIQAQQIAAEDAVVEQESSVEEIAVTAEETAIEEEKGFLDRFSAFINDGTDAISNGVTQLTDGVQSKLAEFAAQLNTMVDTMAVMIVTSCLIPVLVLFFAFWFVGVVTGIDMGSAKRVFTGARDFRRKNLPIGHSDSEAQVVEKN